MTTIRQVKKGDRVVALENLHMNGDYAKAPCVEAGEVYTVATTFMTGNDFGIYLTKCSARFGCDCVNSWWNVKGHNDVDRFRPWKDGEPVGRRDPILDFINIRRGDEVIAKKSISVRDDLKECIVEGETYIVKELAEMSYHGYPEGVYLTKCDSGRNCQCLHSWWHVENFRLPDHRNISEEDKKKASYLPSVDDVAQYVNLKPVNDGTDGIS